MPIELSNDANGVNMLNYLWAFMILTGVVYGTVTGNAEALGNGIMEGGGEAVSLCITMLGVVSIWTGLMNIAQKSGLIESLREKLRPVIRYLFPSVPPGHPAAEYIAMNLIANICGLGWAATPAGLKAMEQLAVIQDEKAGCHIETASDDMCTFLVVNISSIQLIPVNIIACRMQYGSTNPAAIIVPGLIATTVSTAAGIICCRIFSGKRHKHIPKSKKL